MLGEPVLVTRAGGLYFKVLIAFLLIDLELNPHAALGWGWHMEAWW